MTNQTKVLLVGPAPSYGRLIPYAKAFEKLGCVTEVFDTRNYYKISLLNKILNRLIKTPVYLGVGRLNSTLLEKADGFRPNVVFFVKPIYISKNSVLEIKKLGAAIFSWYPDDIFYSKNASKAFYEAVPFYDCHFTTKTFNVKELLEASAKKAVFLPHALNTECHHPISVSEDDKNNLGADIVFVGTYAKDERADYLERLCEDGYNVRIYGGGWERFPKNSCLSRKGCLQLRDAYCDDLSRIFNSSKIVLAFLRKHNRDQQTGRTYEIPGCGAFMLHERTEEARTLFKEDVEAEFFGSYEEMKRKIDFYLAHPEERRRIAEAGYKRAIQADYSYEARAGLVLGAYNELR